MTIREFLGDDAIMALQKQGFSKDAVINFAKDEYIKYKNAKREELFNRGVNNDNINKIFRGELSEGEALKKARYAKDIESPWTRLGMNFFKEPTESALGYSKLPDDAVNFFDEDRKKAMKDKDGNVDYGIDWAKKAKKGIDLFKEKDKAWHEAHPNEWDVAGTIGGILGSFIDPINLIPMGAVFNKGKLLTQIGKKSLFYGGTGAVSGAIAAHGGDRDVAEGAAMGAVSAAVLGTGLEYGGKALINSFKKIKDRRVASAENKEAQANENIANAKTQEEKDIAISDAENARRQKIQEQAKEIGELYSVKKVENGEDITTDDIVEDVIPNESPDVKKQVAKDLKENKDSSVIDQQTYEDVKEYADNISEAAFVKANEKQIKKFEKHVQDFGQNVGKAEEDSMLRFNEAQSEVSKKIKENPNISPDFVRDFINVKYKPTNEEILISNIINDGVPVEPRFAGYNILHALKQSMSTPPEKRLSDEQMLNILKRSGYNDKNIDVFMQAFTSNDISIANRLFSEKITNKGVEYGTIKVNEEFNNARASGDTQTEITQQGLTRHSESDNRRGSTTKEQYQGSEGASLRDTSDTLRYSRQHTASPSESGRVSASDDSVDGYEPASSDGTGDVGASRDTVVSKQDEYDSGLSTTRASDTAGRARLLDEASNNTLAKDEPLASDIQEPTKANEQENTTQDTQSNYDLNNKEPIRLDKRERVELNKKALEILKKDVKDISDEDREILRLYTGRGGLKNGEAGFTEFYTPYPVIKSMYKALDDAGVEIKNALEPAVGSGNFVGMKPELNWTTIDIDPNAHEVVKRLYSKGKHYHTRFESFKKGDYDLVISNVPFLERRGGGRNLDRTDVRTLHDYFFVKGIDSVKDDGILAFITSRGVADKIDTKIRAELMSKADVIGMYRLADKSFSQNAHTDVGTDIIFLQKRGANKQISEAQKANNDAFIKSSKTADDIYLNEYFQKHPENILGDLKAGISKFHGDKAYEVLGESDLSRIKIKPSFEEKIKKQEVMDKMPLEADEFKKWASDNNVKYYDIKNPELFIGEKGIKKATQTVEFSDIKEKVRIYEDITNTPNGKKIMLLDKIKKASEKQDLEGATKLINQYKERFKKHPYNDNALVRTFGDENTLFHDYASFFDKDFTPKEIAIKRTRFENMGRLDVDADSPLEFRLKASMGRTGEIDFSKPSEILNKQEFHRSLDHGYSVSGINLVTNDVLYYAGNLRKKLDNIDKLKQTYIYDDVVLNKLESQKLKLEESLPPVKTIDDFEINGNEPWLIDNNINIYKLEKVVKYSSDGKASEEYKSEFGEVFDNYLNSRKLIARGKDENIAIYKQRLREAQERVKDIKFEIKERVNNNPELKQRVESIYNNMFNSYVTPDYTKAKFLVQDAINEAAEGFRFRDNQIAWAAKAIFEGKGINSHDVGGGKTAAAILLAKALKLRGMSQKPLFVVPSKVMKNWESEIKRIYPGAKIINLYNLPAEKRVRMLSELGNSRADYVLISHEGFEKLALPQEATRKYLNEFLIENTMNLNDKGRQEALNKERTELLLETYHLNQEDKKLTLDRLGIDSLIIDEARAFKNVGFSSKIAKDGLGVGINIKRNKKTGKLSFGSNRAYDVFFKARYISERNNNSNIFMLDATPTPNKPMELYTVLRMLDNKILDEYGIYDATIFKDRYFSTSEYFAQDGRFKTGLTEIKNFFELDGIKSRFIDYIPMEDFAKNGITIPKENIQFHYLDANDNTVAVFEDIFNKMEKAKSDADGKNKMMGYYSEAVNASADPRLYQSKDFIHGEFIEMNHTNNKIKAAIKMVSEKRQANKDAGQIIFLDNAGHSAVFAGALKKNLHKKIKDELVASGKFKESEIAIISGNEATNVKTGKESNNMSGEKMMQAKQDIVDAYNAGKIKVVIGTTQTAGEGLNIQKYTTDIYHLNLPWTPAEIKQRNGRGVRSGNINDEVNTHFFMQAGTIDSLMYETVLGKRGWNDALYGKEKANTMSVSMDDSAAMPSAEQVMLALARDPIKRAELELKIKHNSLLSKRADLFDARRDTDFSIKSKNVDITNLQGEIRMIQENLKSDTPTKEAQGLFEKMVKEKDLTKKQELQNKYDSLLAKTKAFNKKRLQSKESSLKLANQKLETLKKNMDTINDELKAVDKEVKDFEATNLDENGNIKLADGVC
ncbi:putative helicase [Campylobacter pinnipediorum subsp. caledonicus]|uniref:Putative helicase n=1 Tax=Campylobacter pinnipediorum subsp. caledonicus TaxID=1874362 RepID=A0A1S6U5X1_9BACT|nr:SNF2-related protein [Campylobacter pinnipediorum]AQW87089.1 putative helicase [Campylobacter pinnipediorum subsp. caledonicus]